VTYNSWHSTCKYWFTSWAKQAEPITKNYKLFIRVQSSDVSLGRYKVQEAEMESPATLNDIRGESPVSMSGLN
jgi:hypothetical protein